MTVSSRICALATLLLAACSSKEEVADVAHLKTLERPDYTLVYPGNWRVQRPVSNVELDRGVRVMSPGECRVDFAFPDEPVHKRQMLQALTMRRANFMGKTLFENYEFFGRYSGMGMVLRGPLAPESAQRGEHSVFVYSGPFAGFSMTRECSDAAMPMVRSGFFAIERNFVFHPRKKPPKR